VVGDPVEERRPNIILSARSLSKTYASATVQEHVLQNIDLDIYQGELVIIMGPSGAGKSTLLHTLSGLDKPTLGTVVFCDQVISKFSDKQLAQFRRKHCGFVFQEARLIDNLDALENVCLMGYLLDLDNQAVLARAKSLLTQLDLKESSWSKFPHQLSRGEAVRVSLARALIHRPNVIFADEPTGALNSKSGELVLDALGAANRSGQTVVMVTHDLDTACRGSRVLYLHDGALRGSCTLGVYQGTDGARRTQLEAFLASHGW